jgi:hypothetical protein
MWRRKGLLTGMAALAFLVMAPVEGGAQSEMVELDSLAKLYEPVSFGHDMHVEMVEGDCASCHHHTLGTGQVDPACARCHQNSGAADAVACRDCHPAERFGAEYLREMEKDVTLFHRDKPGLKAAYHLKCLGCHREAGGPTGCQDCHALTDKGEAFYRTGKYAPPPITEGHDAEH